MSTAPAGWYADAQREGYERWFDGAGWTDERRPASVPESRTRSRATGWVPVTVAFMALLAVMCGGAYLLAEIVLDTSVFAASRPLRG
ncbi:DUF2510 domain-containing protein [Cellulosimicrobium cellulans]|uniref:DUF2510 domain-containing protein n=1 Tax=Cellulosimicrobium cellulans TaxID=1710 RepID=UPI0008488388|nr:DUF2510 domain-containing protein [Cellulosimicrobium cellulans]